MKDKYVTLLLLFLAIVLEREKKSTVRVILYKRINIDLNTTSSIELSAEYYKQKKERNESDLL